MMQEQEERPNSGRVLIGLVIAAIGIVMLIDRTGFADVRLTGRFWPFILIALGVAKMLEGPRRPGRRIRRSGVWLLGIGLWGLISEFRVLGFVYDTSWPLLIIGVGAAMIWRAFEGPRPGRDRRVEGSS